MVSGRGFVLLIVTCLWSWYAMMAVHELGHVIGACATGGHVSDVVLEFASFSRTDVHPNPKPLFVVWMGPVAGVVLPLAAWLVARGLWHEIAVLFRFFAGFCLVVNGAYIGGGSFDGIGDAGDMMDAGSPIWALWLFGLVCFAGGLMLWHGIGRRLGVTRNGPRLSRQLMVASLAMCVIAILCVVII